MYRAVQAAWRPSEGFLGVVTLNGKHCYTYNNWHGDCDLTPMFAYKFFEKFATHDTKTKMRLNLDVPSVTPANIESQIVTLSNGQRLNQAFYDYYQLRYPNAQLKSAGKHWPVIWVQDNTIKGFVCPKKGQAN